MKTYSLSEYATSTRGPAIFRIVHVSTGMCIVEHGRSTQLYYYLNSLISQIRHPDTLRRKALREWIARDPANRTLTDSYIVAEETDLARVFPPAPPHLSLQSRPGRPPMDSPRGISPFATNSVALERTLRYIGGTLQDALDRWPQDRRDFSPAALAARSPDRANFALYLWYAMKEDNNVNPKPSAIAQAWAEWYPHHAAFLADYPASVRTVPADLFDVLAVPHPPGCEIAYKIPHKLVRGARTTLISTDSGTEPAS